MYAKISERWPFHKTNYKHRVKLQYENAKYRYKFSECSTINLCNFTRLKMEFVIKDKSWTINTENEIQSERGMDYALLKKKKNRKKKLNNPFKSLCKGDKKHFDIEWRSIEPVVNESKFLLKGRSNC